MAPMGVVVDVAGKLDQSYMVDCLSRWRATHGKMVK